jgi:hypothetical protein
MLLSYNASSNCPNGIGNKLALDEHITQPVAAEAGGYSREQSPSHALKKVKSVHYS